MIQPKNIDKHDRPWKMERKYMPDPTRLNQSEVCLGKQEDLLHYSNIFLFFIFTCFLIASPSVLIKIIVYKILFFKKKHGETQGFTTFPKPPLFILSKFKHKTTDVLR